MSDTLAEPFLSGTASFAHGITFAGHPVSCAMALANLDVFEREGIVDHVQANASDFRRRMDSFAISPSSAMSAAMATSSPSSS